MHASDPLLPYVSATVVRRLMADPASALRSDVNEVSVAALFADVSDSTSIVEGLAERGREGAERFSLLLDVYFTELIETIWRFGGQVLKFDGDAVLAIWRVRRTVSPVQAVTQAAACAEAFQRRVLEIPTGSDGRLSLRAGVGAGTASIVHVSDGVRRSELFMIGPAMAETVQAAKAAERGGVAYGARAAQLLDNVDHGGNAAAAYAAPASTADSGNEPPDYEAVTSVFAHYVPEVVRVRAQDGHNMCLADLRTVTTVFVGLGLDGIEVDSKLFDAIALVMQQVERCGGDVARVGAQRNGVAVLAAFGLPPHAHEDDADRGARCATMLRDALVAGGIEVSVGVTTGRVICGPVGSVRRREYTMIGDAVNVAARLMNAAANGSVLCDADTRQASRGSVRFGQPRTLAPRGRKRVVEIFETIGYGQARPTPGVEMIGRGSERARLDEALRELEEAGNGSVFVIEGEAGIGKSCLAAFAADRARALGLGVVSGGGEAIESQTPFHAWRRIVLVLLGLPSRVDAGNVDAAASSHVDVAAIESLLVTLCGMDPQLARRNAPLLGAVLGTHFQENAWTAQLSPHARVEQTMSLVVRILTGRAGDSEHRDEPPQQHRARLVVMLEDAQWFDASSWGVLHMAAQEPSSLLIIVTSRPNQASEYAALRSVPDVHLLLLTGLETQDIQTLVAHRLGVASVPFPLVEFLCARSHGHPFFTQELLDALRRAGALLLYGGECRLPPQDLERLGLPLTVEGVVAGRIDGLRESESSLLKVASIFGGTFTAADVAVLDPACRSTGEILDSLDSLVHVGLLDRLAGLDETFSFHHAIIQTAAYETVTFAQRRRLHRTAAESLGTREETAAAVLAYHWSRAVDRQAPRIEIVERAVAAIEAAGQQAIDSFDSLAAVALFSDALTLAGLLSGVADAARRARWHQRVGEASFRMGLPAEARKDLLVALDLLGWPMPSSPARVRAELVVAILHQIAHRMLPAAYAAGVGATLRRDPDRIAELRQMASISSLLAFVMLLMGESEASALANLRALNAADHAGACAELATSAVHCGNAAGVFLGGRIERLYFKIGRRTAESIGDDTTLGRIFWMRSFYLLSRARWDDAYEMLDRSRAIFEQVGDSRSHETSVMAIGAVFMLRYRVAPAIEAYMRGYRAAHARGDVQGEAWSHVGMSQGKLLLGRHQEALAMLAQVEAWMGGNLKNFGDRASELAVLGMRAAILARERNAAGARQVLQLAHASLGRPIFIYHAVTGYTFLAEASMRLLEAVQQDDSSECCRARGPSGISPAADPELRRLASDFERALWTFGRLLPIGRAQAWVWRGSRLWFDGKHRRAMRAWDRATAVAAELKMPYDEALAHYEVGRHLSLDDPRRSPRLELARALFTEIGAEYWVRRVECEQDDAAR